MSHDERVRILGLCKDGKVSVEEAAELLEALPAGPPLASRLDAGQFQWVASLDRWGSPILFVLGLCILGLLGLGIYNVLVEVPPDRRFAAHCLANAINYGFLWILVWRIVGLARTLRGRG